MDDFLCRKFALLRTYLPDELNTNVTSDFEENPNFKKYCYNQGSGVNECNTDLDKITVGFLWLLEQYFTISKDISYNENNTNAFFLYVISWFSYKLKQNSEHNTTKINDFYTEYVNNSNKYGSFKSHAYRYTDLKEFIAEQKDLLNINIEDLSKFYDAFKLICSMYGNFETNKHEQLPDNATSFVNKYTELKDDSNIKGTLHSQLLSALLTDYNNLKEKCKDIQPLPEITSNIYALSSGYTSSSSSIGKKLFTVLSIFGAIAFLLGISYKYSLFGFRKRAQKQYLREKIKKIKKRMNH
ncbi:uncharacterized protein PY17X_1371900 [Plasmodium yoelii]|uniref:Yir3 protein n=3 Tax=Plasmodium yoelii TaxID=5861 RepID=Q7RII7_PLAYO|nr:uncharacterized protein PY17X_1371900 [Plasmodium yoelii]EAA15385.1 putative yir3 protein [Plasmodium yoelii yoelii]WBY60476.1 PIR protein [Plasmodium yoelii yoelii]CDU20328.1 YIR protein [Plasmodium yoelii]VTZ81086.1 PIR protein [Plasmodium yoelii]|eukprot:XP_723820.1 uncharacterized protein PY17X_1371900 [Plasmodium yoelii]